MPPWPPSSPTTASAISRQDLGVTGAAAVVLIGSIAFAFLVLR
ncbi:hypothetical protein [Mycobacterium shottsii]|nr:hypothetical protein [Mycobacterium shottsii]